MRRGLATWALALLLPAVAHAQDTRAALLERERAEKAKRLTPYEETKVEKLVKDVEDGKYQRMIMPHNGFFAEYGYSYKPAGAGIGFGGGWRHDLFDRNARVELEAGISFRNYRLLRGDFSLPRLADERVELGVEWTYRHQPQDDFFGLGPDSSSDDRTNYLFEGRELQGRAVFKPRDWLRAGVRVGALQPEIGRGTDSRFPATQDRFPASAIPGLTEQPDYVYGDLFGEIDYRDEPGNARDGGYYSLTLSRYGDRDLDRFSFRRVDALAMHFFPIFDKKRVFAFQFQLTSASPDEGHAVPFFLQPTLGGSHALRSAADYRYRDLHMMAFGAEYRWEAFSLLDMALFTDFGKVAPRAGDLDLSDLKRGYGIGFRFNTASSVFLRLDIAGGGGEGLRYHFKFSNSF